MTGAVQLDRKRRLHVATKTDTKRAVLRECYGGIILNGAFWGNTSILNFGGISGNFGDTLRLNKYKFGHNNGRMVQCKLFAVYTV